MVRLVTDSHCKEIIMGTEIIDGAYDAENEEDFLQNGDASDSGAEASEPDEESHVSGEEGEGDESENEEELLGQPERHVGRAGGRIQKLLEDTKSYREQLQNTRSELEVLKSQLSHAAAVRTEEQLQYMDPEQRRAYEDQKWRNSIEQAVQYQRAIAEDTADKSDFRDLVINSPTAAKFASKVEEEVARLRNQGVNIQRKHVYYHLLGQEVDSRASKSTAKAKKSGEANVRKQSVRPSNGRSNVRANENANVSSWQDFEAKFGNTSIRGSLQ